MKSFRLVLQALLLTFSFAVVNAQMNVGSMRIGQGVTAPGDWQDYFNLGIFVDVNTSACGFTETPHYLVTLESITNNGYHWYISGAPSIYFPTPTGFRVYLRWTDHPTEEPTIGNQAFANPLRAVAAQNRGWVIRWTAISTGDCAACDGDVAQNPEPEVDPFGNEGKTPGKMANPEPQSDVIIFPNPATSELTLRTVEQITKSEVYDQNGRLLQTSRSEKIDISNLTEGSYTIKVYMGEEVVSKKFVKMF